MAARLRALRVPLPYAAEAIGGILDAGDALLPLPVDASAGVVDDLLATFRPASITEVDAEGHSSTRRLADPVRLEDGTALVVATSGSTGRPKGVELSRAALRASVEASLRRLGCRRGDRWVLALPPHHVAGVSVLLRAWALGRPPLVARGTTELAATEAGFVSLVPTQLGRLIEAGAAASFGTVLLGGAAAPPALLARARAAGVTVVSSYGMTETCGGCVYDGHPLADVEVALDAAGRVRLRGPVLFTAYRGRDGRRHPPLDADGWFTTADLGRLRTDGRLEVLGRADDVAVTGGENVPLPAVRAALATHPAVAEVAVVARDDATWGQRVVAVVVPGDPAALPGVEELRRHVRDQAPATHAPREVLFAATLPRDAMGKVTAASVARAFDG